MKIIFQFSLFCLAVAMGQPMVAQTNSQNGPQNYVVLTKKVEQLTPILLSAEALKIEDGAHFGAFKVIICGKNIGDVTDLSMMEPHLEKASKLGVDLIACGFSLKKFKVDADKVPEEMSTVDNGILYNLQMQKMGYKSLGL